MRVVLNGWEGPLYYESVDEGSHEAAKRPANFGETLAVTDENFRSGVSYLHLASLSFLGRGVSCTRVFAVSSHEVVPLGVTETGSVKEPCGVVIWAW